MLHRPSIRIIDSEMAGDYIVSARKYRPETFASIVGQGAMSSTLRTAVQQGRMAHAYLFCGPRGVGKTTAARVLAKTINCQSPTPEGEACHECESCRAFAEQRSFNIFELDAASNNSVEDIRSLTEQVAIAPALGRYKVYIIDEVHMLSSAAFNAFLKTLEEPPAYAIFILATTEKHKVLPTILSRCQIYDFKRITVRDIAQHLAYVASQEHISYEEEALSLIAEKADGGMRDALSMFDRVASYANGHITYADALECLNVLDYSQYMRMLDAMLGGDYHGLLLVLDELLARGFDGQIIIGGLANFLRDLLMVQHPQTAHLLEKPESVMQRYQDRAKLIVPAMIHQSLKSLVQCDQQYRSASNKRLLVELTLLNIVALFSPSTLAMPEVKIEPKVASPQPKVVASQPIVSVEAQPTVSSSDVSSLAVQTSSKPPTPSVQSAAVIVPPVQSAESRDSRRSFRALGRRRSVQEGQEVVAETSSSQVEYQSEPFDELSMQRAWRAFIERGLDEHAILDKQFMSQAMPSMISTTTAEVGFSDSAAILDRITPLLPQAELFMRRELRNSDFELKIRHIADVAKRTPITSEDKYKIMVEENPHIAKLTNTMGFRLI